MWFIIESYEFTTLGTKEPQYLAKYLTEDIIRRKILIPNTNLSLAKRSFMFDGAELWNSLPPRIRNIQNKLEFKTELRRWITAKIPMFR